MSPIERYPEVQFGKFGLETNKNLKYQIFTRKDFLESDDQSDVINVPLNSRKESLEFCQPKTHPKSFFGPKLFAKINFVVNYKDSNRQCPYQCYNSTLSLKQSFLWFEQVGKRESASWTESEFFLVSRDFREVSKQRRIVGSLLPLVAYQECEPKKRFETGNSNNSNKRHTECQAAFQS